MKDLPYTVITKKDRIEQAKQWCEQHIGPRWVATKNHNGKWCVFWVGPSRRRESLYGMYEWSFQNEKDALLFGLKWS